MLVLTQGAATSALSSTSSTTTPAICPSSSINSSSSSPFKSIRPKTTLFSKRNTIFNLSETRERQRLITLASAKSSNDGANSRVVSSQQSVSTSTGGGNGPVLVDGERVPLEGVIQFEKPNYSSRVEKWGKIALLAGGDVLALVLFSAIGRFSHGFSVLDFETLRTADPFIAGWFLSAYFLGGYSEDGRGLTGLNKAVAAAAKSWALGIPLGLGIRGLTTGHFPPNNFVWVTLGSTALLLIGWRTLLFSIFPANANKKDDMYRKGNPFELFELLTSLIRRW